MSLQAVLDSGGDRQVATNRGWGDFTRWAADLPAEGFRRVRHLAAHGWSQDLPALGEELPAALAAHPPRIDGVSSIVDGIVGFLRDDPRATVIVVNDGTGVAR